MHGKPGDLNNGQLMQALTGDSENTKHRPLATVAYSADATGALWGIAELIR